MDSEYYRLLVPHFFGGEDSPDEESLSQIVSKYPAITSPCSMYLDSIEELSEHMVLGYQVAHFHYILGKGYNLRGSFPSMCCGLSSRNVMMSLIELGYPNAAYAYSQKCDHGYTILPFVFGKKKSQGTIVIDPTSDQLWLDPHDRNAVFIKMGSSWEYRTDWKDGGNLFPNRICSIDIVREKPDKFIDRSYYHVGGKKYFRKAFSNQILIRK